MKITKDMLLIDAFRMGNQEKMAEVCKASACTVWDARLRMGKR